MHNRRTFLQNTSLALAANLLPWPEFLFESAKIKKVGIQLFSLPKSLDLDFVGTIKMLSLMGYKEIEVFGPYPFSTQSAKDSWNAVTPMLGFKGSGYFGKTAKEVRQIFDDNGLSSPSAHTDLDTLINKMDELGEAAQILGHQYVVLPSIPDVNRKTLDDYKRTAETFNKIGENAKKVGLKFAYHNHGYGLNVVNGQMPIDIIFDQTDKNLVFFEMDVFWTAAGGANPIQMFEKHPGRYHLVHIKDMKEKKVFSGDGSTPNQWIELFPYMATAGSGVLEVQNIVKKAVASGVKHIIVEQDMVAQPEIALKQSYDFVKKVRVKK
jgi:sugar phosphate isomerase/epimerase